MAERSRRRPAVNGRTKHLPGMDDRGVETPTETVSMPMTVWRVFRSMAKKCSRFMSPIDFRMSFATCSGFVTAGGFLPRYFRVFSSATYMTGFLPGCRTRKRGAFEDVPKAREDETEKGTRNGKPVTPPATTGSGRSTRTSEHFQEGFGKKQPDRMASATDSISRAVQARSSMVRVAGRRSRRGALVFRSASMRSGGISPVARKRTSAYVESWRCRSSDPVSKVRAAVFSFHERAVLLHEVDDPRSRMSSTSPVSGSARSISNLSSMRCGSVSPTCFGVEEDEFLAFLREDLLRFLRGEDDRLQVLGEPVGLEHPHDGFGLRSASGESFPVEPLDGGVDGGAEDERGGSPGSRDLVDVVEAVLEGAEEVGLDLANAERLHWAPSWSRSSIASVACCFVTFARSATSKYSLR